MRPLSISKRPCCLERCGHPVCLSQYLQRASEDQMTRGDRCVRRGCFVASSSLLGCLPKPSSSASRRAWPRRCRRTPASCQQARPDLFERARAPGGLRQAPALLALRLRCRTSAPPPPAAGKMGRPPEEFCVSRRRCLAPASGRTLALPFPRQRKNGSWPGRCKDSARPVVYRLLAATAAVGAPSPSPALGFCLSCDPNFRRSPTLDFVRVC